MTRDLDTRIRSLAISLGADYYGVADLSPAWHFIWEQGGDRVAQYPIAVVAGIRLQDSLVNLLPDQDPEGAIIYRHNSYDVVNQMLDQIGIRIANELQRSGHQAFPVPASKRTDNEKISGIFSQKLAAHLAGLGWIGKSCLLITPDYGPRVRWVSILTDAPIPPTGPALKPRCGDCRDCVDACPIGAFTGRIFEKNEPREARFDAAACDRYFKEMEKTKGVAVCGMCLYACPYGKKSAVRKEEQ